MVVRITIMVLRISVVAALILGILFWTHTADNLTGIHILLGILVTLSLWILGVMIGITKGGNWGLGAGAIVLGLLVLSLGLTQRSLLVGSPLHWIIQVLHLLLGLTAMGLGEMIAGRYKRLSKVAG